jgi:inorganic pyrophosphatase
LFVSTLVTVPIVYLMAFLFLPTSFVINGVSKDFSVGRYDAASCVITGTFGGLVIGFVAEYYTSHSYPPVKRLIQACRSGAGTNIIHGLALGYQSTIVPVIVLAAVVYTGFELCDLYGIALAAVGMLGNISMALTIDAYGPVCDNAGR